MKKFLAGLGILSLVLLAAAPVFAAEAGPITATVTPQLVSVTVDVSNVGYGTQNLSTTDNTPTGDPEITATNNGNVAENFTIKGDDATDGSNIWTLSNTAGADAYVHKFNNDTGTYPDSSSVALDKAGKSLSTSVSGGSSCTTFCTGGGSEAFKLRMDTPASTSSFAEHSTTVTVVASAS